MSLSKVDFILSEMAAASVRITISAEVGNQIKEALTALFLESIIFLYFDRNALRGKIVKC